MSVGLFLLLEVCRREAVSFFVNWKRGEKFTLKFQFQAF